MKESNLFSFPKQQNLHPEDQRPNLKEGGKTVPPLPISGLAAVNLDRGFNPLFAFQLECFQSTYCFDPCWHLVKQFGSFPSKTIFGNI